MDRINLRGKTQENNPFLSYNKTKNKTRTTKGSTRIIPNQN
jgi:hypothetical protein